jgi:hypothetical protein
MHRSAAALLILCASTAARPDVAAVLARSPIHDGPVPGAPNLIVEHRPDATRCGGERVTVRVDKRRRPSKADHVEPELMASLTLEAPTGLDFTSDDAHTAVRKKSMERFKAFLDDATRKATAARTVYDHLIVDHGSAPQDTVIAAARIAQIYRRFAEATLRMEIPRDARTGPHAADATAAFCDALADQVEPLLGKADEAAAACGAQAAKLGVAPGWWDAVCTAPPPPPPPPPPPGSTL